jgi:hypothetical protein
MEEKGGRKRKKDSYRHSRGSGNPGLVKKKYKKNGDEKIYYSTGFPLPRE